MKKVYNKLVRDKMIDIYRDDVKAGIVATDFSVRYLPPHETLAALKDKLLEEVYEVFEAYSKPDNTELKEEIADVIEVIDAILYHNDVSLEEVLYLREAKKAKKGGFETGLFLKSIDYVE